MKKSHRTVIIIIVALAVGYFFLGREDFTISDVEWICDEEECDVSFNVANRSHNKYRRSISIRAHRQKMVGGEALVHRLVGEKKLSISLAPFERKRIEEKLKLSVKGKVHLIAVNVWGVD